MRRLIQLALVVLGIRALLRWHRRRQADSGAGTEPTQPTAVDPADELRQKLAESRSEGATDESPAADAAVEDRRAEVHEQGRAALDDMKSSDEG